MIYNQTKHPLSIPMHIMPSVNASIYSVEIPKRKRCAMQKTLQRCREEKDCPNSNASPVKCASLKAGVMQCSDAKVYGYTKGNKTCQGKYVQSKGSSPVGRRVSYCRSLPEDWAV